MITHGKALPKRCLAFALAAAMLCPPGSLLVAAQAQETPPAVPQAAPAPPAPVPPAGTAIRIPMAPVATGPIHTILLFPFANAMSASSSAGGFSPDLVGARVEDAVKLRLNVIGRFKANSFSPTLPQIQRALQEARVEGLSENDLQPPYDDAQKGERIAAQVGTDGYLLGTIEALRVDANHNVSLTVTATLYNSTTGTAARALAFTGRGVSYNPSDDQDALLQSAINDVAGQIVSALNASSPQEHLAPVDYARGHHSNGGSILLGILLAAAVGIAIGSSHHGSSNNSSSTTTTTTTTGSGGPPSPPAISSSSSTSPPNPPNP